MHTRFVNKLGGKVAVMGCSIFNESSNFFNYRKKEVLRGVLNWLNGEPLPVTMLNAPNMWVLFRKKGDTAYMMITNLCPDSTEQLEAAIAPAWQNKVIEELNADGIWQKAEYCQKDAVTIISGASSYMTPRMFRLK